MKLVSKILKRTDWYVTCNFGYHRVGGRLEYHCGTDYGTNNQKWHLYGIEQGVVLSCGAERDGSKYIWLNYPRIGKKLLHCHLDRIDVKAGQQIQEGTLLGAVGNTGCTCGIHLHLGMQPRGSNGYEDPHIYEYSPPADIMNTDATVYGGPSATLYAPIGSVVKNGTINILNIENEYYYISYWTNSGLLKRGYVAVSQINRNTSKTVADVTESFRGNNNIVHPQTTVYSGPDTTTAVIGTVFEQEGVTQFTLEENGHHFIEYSTPEGAKRGYVLSSNLIQKEGGLAIASTAADVYYTYSLESKAGAIYANEYVTILQKNDQRSYIEYNTTRGRKRGYVSNSSLQFLGVGNVPALPNYSEEALMPTETMNVYFGPSDQYAVVGSINKGERVTRLSSPTFNTGNYSFIQYSTAEDPQRGYVAASGLIPYVPGVVPDPGPSPDPDPNPNPNQDPDVLEQWPVGKVAGSFLQDWGANAFTEKMWDDELCAMKYMGMKYLIIQQPLMIEDPETKEKSFNEPAYKDCLRAAKKHGIKLMLGLSSDKYCSPEHEFFTNIDKAKNAVKIDVEEAKETLKSIAKQVQELSDAEDIDYSELICGWYFIQEFYNSNKFIPSRLSSILPFIQDSSDQYREVMSSHLNQYIEAIQAASYVDKNGTPISLDRSLVLSPYYKINHEAPHLCNPAQYAQFLTSMFAATKFRGQDILMPQDGFGTNNIDQTPEYKPEDVKPWLAVYQKAAEERGIFLWINNENFGVEEDEGIYFPIPVEKFIRNYELTGEYVKEQEEHIVFTWNHYYNPMHVREGYTTEMIKEYHKQFRNFVVDTYLPLEILVKMVGARIVADDRNTRTVKVEMTVENENGDILTEMIYADQVGTPFIDETDHKWYVWYPEFLSDFDL